MSDHLVLLFTDVVDSTQLSVKLGDGRMTAIWEAHDRLSRDLARRWLGREIGRSDGFLLLFSDVAGAVGFASDYHEALGTLSTPLMARVGIHIGLATVRENSDHDREQGATRFEVDGVALPIAARIMSVAQGRQTLLSAEAADALAREAHGLLCHGFWRLKGLDEPIELFEAVESGALSTPPQDSAKAYRVVRTQGRWLPRREIPHSLPAERDAFVGRDGALQDLSRRFEHGARLISLLGTGGTGKTRLAIHYGWDWLGDFPGGVWFCDLSVARTMDGIVHAMAQGLLLTLAGSDPGRQIGNAIGGRGDCLIIVDNFEQVSVHAEATVGRWLELAPEARFVVTTRELLGITGEVAVDLSPLEATDGATLLRQRAIAAGAATFTTQDEHALPQLIALLDGLPLAIELAASRMRVMPPAALLPRMGERFRLLASAHGRRDRQATLLATLDWSWELLSGAERDVLVQLSVFEGGFTLGAAEAVVELSQEGPALWVVDVVQSLVDKSLVRRRTALRFDLLRSVQEYASQPIADPRSRALPKKVLLGDAMRRHWSFYGSLDEVAATAERCVETQNLVIACRRAIAGGDIEAAANALSATWSALRLTGPFATAIELADELQRRSDVLSSAAATALWVGGNARQLLGRTTEAREMLEQALVKALGDETLSARIACTLGTLESSFGNRERANALLETALASAREAADDRLLCRALNGLGALRDMQSRPDEAQRWYEAALAVAQRCEDPRWQGAVLSNLGQLHHNQSAYAEALRCYESSLIFVEESGDLRFEGNTRCNLGLLHHEQGRREEAMTEFVASLDIAMRIGHVQLQAVVSCNIGLAHEAAGSLAEALEHFRQALACSITLAQRRAEALNRIYLARVLFRSGSATDAHELLSRAQELLVSQPEPRTLVLLLCAQAELQLKDGSSSESRRLLQSARSAAREVRPVIDAELGREIDRIERLISQC